MLQKDYNKLNIKIRGWEWHILKLAEECSELSAAILQWKCKDTSMEHIEKEIADVLIGINYYILINGSKNIAAHKAKKLGLINKKVRSLVRERRRLNAR